MTGPQSVGLLVRHLSVGYCFYCMSLLLKSFFCYRYLKVPHSNESFMVPGKDLERILLALYH